MSHGLDWTDVKSYRLDYRNSHSLSLSVNGPLDRTTCCISIIVNVFTIEARSP